MAAGSDYQRLKRLFNEVCDLPDEAAQRARLAELLASEADLERVIAMLSPGRSTHFGAPVAGILAAAAGSELNPGDRLGPWRLEGEIGAGGMGRVFAAERDDGLYQQRAAIKVLLGWAGVDALARLARERQILASMAHPNIARLLDGGTTPMGRPYLVMEFVDGVPIDAWCRQRTRGVDGVLDLMLMVCDAVAAAHRQLVVHCDLKPSNVMVTPEGRALLLDFGIAQLQGQDTPAEDEEGEGIALTPRYASPEQKAGLPATVASDIFGLGRLLDELMQLATVAPGDPPAAPPRAAEWQAIVERATQDAPADRYATVQALIDDIHRFRRNQPLQALPPTPAYVGRKWLVRHWPWALAGSLALAGAVAFTLRLVVERDRARSAEQRALLEAATTRQVSDFVIELFKGADPRQAGRPDLPANVLVERGRDRVATDLQGQPALQAALKMVVAEVFENIGQSKQAVQLYLEAAALERSGAVDRPLRAAAALSRMAVVLANTADAPRGVAAARESLALREERLPADAPEIADSLNSLGVALNRARQVDEAHRHLERSLQIRTARFGPDSVEVASTLHNLGLVQMTAERPAEAEVHYRRALAIKRARLPPLHLSTLNTMVVLATSLREQQRLAESEPLMLELIEARRKLHGVPSQQVADALAEYAIGLHDAGRVLDAIARFRESMAAEPERAGVPGNALTLNNLAGALDDAGLADEAEASLRRSIAIRIARLGEGDAAVARARHNLGRLLLRQRRDTEAAPLLEAALAVRLKQFLPDHAEPAISRLALAELALRQGAIDKAAGLLEAALPHEPRANPVRRPLFESARAMLAQARGDPAQALQHWQKAHELGEKLAPGHPSRVRFTLELAEAREAARQPERVRPLLVSLRSQLAGYGEAAPMVQRTARLAARLGV